MDNHKLTPLIPANEALTLAAEFTGCQPGEAYSLEFVSGLQIKLAQTIESKYLASKRSPADHWRIMFCARESARTIASREVYSRELASINNDVLVFSNGEVESYVRATGFPVLRIVEGGAVFGSQVDELVRDLAARVAIEVLLDEVDWNASSTTIVTEQLAFLQKSLE